MSSAIQMAAGMSRSPMHGGASIHTETKAEAVELGRKLCIKEGAELVIHGKDGRIQNSNSYGNDPHPPKDKVRTPRRR
jgi:hypothetical protein